MALSPGLAVETLAPVRTDDALADEESLVALVKARDADAWASLYDRYYPPLFRYAYARIGSREEAEDVAGQVFLDALKNIDRYEYRGKPVLAWLYRIARNLVIDRLRRLRRATESDSLTADSRNENFEASTVQSLALNEAVNRLTRDQREVVILRFFLDLPTRQIAAVLRKKEAAVYSLQVRAMSALRLDLNR